MFGRRRPPGIPAGITAHAQPVIPEPLDISGLDAWWRSDLGITLNGSNVSAWLDQSGNAINAVQATGGAQPAYQTNQLNGKAIVTYDGADGLVSGNRNWSGVTATTIFSVHKNTSGAVEVVMDKGVASGFGTRLEVNATASGKTSQWIRSSDTVANRYETSGANATPINEWQVISSVTDIALGSAETQIYDEGTAEAMTAPAQHTGNLDANTPYGIGCSSTGVGDTIELTGSIAEIIVFTRALTTGERQAIENYLRVRYAL